MILPLTALALLLCAAPPADAPAQRPLHPGPRVERSTPCASCHTPAGWRAVRFDHDRTGFFLAGEHAPLPCRTCHPSSYKQPLPRTCAGCHADPHQGELGGRCEGCHQETSWKSRFGADAHRATAFPLVGRHALLSCEACHGAVASGRFARATPECATCHQRDWDRTLGLTVDHARLGFSLQCRQCHGSVRFAPALYPAHDTCYEISRGSHAGIACLGCHAQLPATSTPGTCATQTAACTGCHSHTCAASDAQHANVAGYQCRDRKCYECHQAQGAR